jgi:hypothetical protein
MLGYDRRLNVLLIESSRDVLENTEGDYIVHLLNERVEGFEEEFVYILDDDRMAADLLGGSLTVHVEECLDEFVDGILFVFDGMEDVEFLGLDYFTEEQRRYYDHHSEY